MCVCVCACVCGSAVRACFETASFYMRTVAVRVISGAFGFVSGSGRTPAQCSDLVPGPGGNSRETFCIERRQIAGGAVCVIAVVVDVDVAVCEAEVGRLEARLHGARRAWDELDEAIDFLRQQEAPLNFRVCVWPCALYLKDVLYIVGDDRVSLKARSVRCGGALWCWFSR